MGPTMTRPSASRRVAETEATYQAAVRALDQLLGAQDAPNPDDRPSQHELIQARHAVKTSRQAYQQAMAAAEQEEDEARRQRDAARRQARHAALAKYQAALEAAAALWPAVIEAGPVVGLGPGCASPEGLAAFTDWIERNIP